MIAVFEKNVLASVWRHADQAVADDTGNPEVTGRVECQSVRKIARAELRDGFASAQCSVFGQLEPRCPPGKGLIDKEMLPGRIDDAFVGVAEAFGCNSGALLVDSYDETIRHIGSGSLVAGMLAGADRDPDIPFVITTNEIGGWQRNSVDFFEERLQRTMAIQLKDATGCVPKMCQQKSSVGHQRDAVALAAPLPSCGGAVGGRRGRDGPPTVSHHVPSAVGGRLPGKPSPPMHFTQKVG